MNQSLEKSRTVSFFVTGALWLSFIVLNVFLSSGCFLTGKNIAAGLPGQHSIHLEQLVVQSDFKLPKDHEVIQDLKKLRTDVASLLDLDFKKREVVVYLFSDKEKYQKFLDATYPGLPPRRAYFVGTSNELAVYTVWGEKIQEDLRHEYTHGLLHAGIKTVPLWLDEGLAEYFEVAGDQPGGLNGSSIARLMQANENGWKPDMARLERLEAVNEMQRMDYQEAWAWIHFMLHENKETRKVLLSYLKDLNTDRTPTPLSERLQLVMPEAGSRLIGYLSKAKSKSKPIPLLNLHPLPHSHVHSVN